MSEWPRNQRSRDSYVPLNPLPETTALTMQRFRLETEVKSGIVTRAMSSTGDEYAAQESFRNLTKLYRSIDLGEQGCYSTEVREALKTQISEILTDILNGVQGDSILDKRGFAYEEVRNRIKSSLSVKEMIYTKRKQVQTIRVPGTEVMWVNAEVESVIKSLMETNIAEMEAAFSTLLNSWKGIPANLKADEDTLKEAMLETGSVFSFLTELGDDTVRRDAGRLAQKAFAERKAAEATEMSTGSGASQGFGSSGNNGRLAGLRTLWRRSKDPEL